MKPIIILPVDTVSKEDIKLLNENGLCVIESKNPALVKFVDPIPSAEQRTKVESAAIQLSRRLLNGSGFSGNGYLTKETMQGLFLEALIKGTPLQSGPTQEEEEERYFTNEKRLELQRLAREEAKEERAAAKKAKTKDAKGSP